MLLSSNNTVDDTELLKLLKEIAIQAISIPQVTDDDWKRGKK